MAKACSSRVLSNIHIATNSLLEIGVFIEQLSSNLKCSSGCSFNCSENCVSEQKYPNCSHNAQTNAMSNAEHML